MLGPCLPPCSFMVMDHAAHTSPQKEQIFTLLMHTPLPRLWCCLYSSPSEELCANCFIFHQAGQLWRQSLLTPRLPSDLNRDLFCLTVSHLIEVTSCSLTASLYIVVAIMNFLLNRHLLQQLEQTDAAVCPARNGGWGAYKYSACCWHIPALIPDLRTQEISILCISRLAGLATCCCHNDIYTIGIQWLSGFSVLH